MSGLDAEGPCPPPLDEGARPRAPGGPTYRSPNRSLQKEGEELQTAALSAPLVVATPASDTPLPRQMEMLPPAAASDQDSGARSSHFTIPGLGMPKGQAEHLVKISKPSASTAPPPGNNH